MADDGQGKGANYRYPKFKAGDSAAGALSISYHNKLTGDIERLNQYAFGPGADALVTGPVIFRKPPRRAAASSVDIIHFSITAFDCNDVDLDGNHYATASVTYTACNATSPSVGDTIEVYDLMGCWLTDAQETLPGRSGTAVKMSHATAYGDGCEWSIIALCGSSVSC